MTMFIKQKIRSTQRDLMQLQRMYVKKINRYNLLVNEYNNQNNFTPIELNSQQPRAEEQVTPKESGSVITPMNASSQTPKGAWSPEKRKAFGEKMKLAREKKLSVQASGMDI